MNEGAEIPLISRPSAVSLFVALCCLVAAVFVLAVLKQNATWASIRSDQHTIEAFDARLAALTARGATPAANGSTWIKAKTMAVAAASIQKVAGDIVAGVGGTVREVQVLQPDGNGTQQSGPLPVSTDFLLETTHDGLRRILIGLGTAQPVLQTSALSIQALPLVGDPNAEVPLRVDVTITGYWDKPSP